MPRAYILAVGSHLELGTVTDLEASPCINTVAASDEVTLLAQFPTHVASKLVQLAGQEIFGVDTIAANKQGLL
jgi:hypothetical protein